MYAARLAWRNFCKSSASYSQLFASGDMEGSWIVYLWKVATSRVLAYSERVLAFVELRTLVHPPRSRVQRSPISQLR